jgi:RNA polymerase sigma factor (sigma-70 family)
MRGVLALRASPERSLESLYRRYAGDVYRYALAVLDSTADAEDVTQTTFINAYRAIERGERPRNARNWLRAIAHNLCRQHFRQAARRPRTAALEEDVGELVADDAPALDDLIRALKQLPYNQRAALVMREFEGRPLSEIAGELDVSRSAVETLLFRARRGLREQLEGGLSCLEAEQAISSQLDGTLARAGRGALRAHLRECDQCATLARRMRAQRGAIKSLALVPLPTSLVSAPLGSGWAASGLAAPLVGKIVAAAIGTALLTGLGYEAIGHRVWPLGHTTGRQVRDPAAFASGGSSPRPAPTTSRVALPSSPRPGQGGHVAARRPLVHRASAPHPRSTSTPIPGVAPAAQPAQAPRAKLPRATRHHPRKTGSAPSAKRRGKRIRSVGHAKRHAGKHVLHPAPGKQRPAEVKPVEVKPAPGGAPKTR